MKRNCLKHDVPTSGKSNKFFYKKWWLWALVLVMLCLMGCTGGNSDSDKSSGKTELSQEKQTKVKQKKADSSSQKKAKAKTSKKTFNPKNVSDSTIESIETYEDYLTMYQKIVDDYLAKYEDIFKDTVLYDESTFQQTKDEVTASFDEQVEQYGDMKDISIVGKDDLVEILKTYRDTLKQTNDALQETVDLLK